MYRVQDPINADCIPSDIGLQARGIVQPEDVRNPKHRDDNDEPCLFVIKNGRTSGTTLGRATGLESFTRTFDEYGIKQTSTEIAIVSYGRAKGHSGEPFSRKGDSGSIVLDRAGRILGMVTGGAGNADSMDISYATPYGYLDKKIREAFPKSFLY